MSSLYFQSDHSRQTIIDCLELVVGFGFSITEAAAIEGCSSIAVDHWVNQILKFKRNRIKCTDVEVRESRINTCF